MLNARAASVDHDTGSQRVQVFSWFWALAAILHLLGTDSLSHIRHGLDPMASIDLVIGLAALVTLVSPRVVSARIVVLVLCPLSAWLGAPRLGNHWLLVAIVDLALLASMVPWLWSRTRTLLDRVHEEGLPTARVMFVCFYVFAAMAKVNSSFLDPTVSCSTKFFGELLASAGVHSIDPMSGSGWTHLIPVVTMVIELAIAVSLCFGRTRLVGAVMLIAFHGLIALDTSHQFADFASVVVALALLSLPDEAFGWFRKLVEARSVLALRLAVATVAAGLLAAQVIDIADRRVRLFDLTRNLMWWSVWLALLGVLGIWILRSHARRSDVAMLPVQRSLLVWPGIVVLIGLAPYLEIRTSASWNMYSNLRTAGGDSNSYVIPLTARLDDAQDDPVRILAADAADLREYIGTDFVVPWGNLRDHLSTAPDTSITYERSGRIVTVAHTHGSPEFAEPVPWWETKIFSFRSYVPEGPSICQSSMWVAR